MPSFVDLQAPTERNPRVTFAQPAAVHALKLGKKQGGEMEKDGLLRWRVYWKGEGLVPFWVGVFCVFFLFLFFAWGNGCVWWFVKVFCWRFIDAHQWILQECSGSATNCMSCYGIAELLPKDGGGQWAICKIWELIWPVVGCWTLWKMQHGFLKSEDTEAASCWYPKSSDTFFFHMLLGSSCCCWSPVFFFHMFHHVSIYPTAS